MILPGKQKFTKKTLVLIKENCFPNYDFVDHKWAILNMILKFKNNLREIKLFKIKLLFKFIFT